MPALLLASPLLAIGAQQCTGFPWGKSMYKGHIAFLTARSNGGANDKGPTLRHLVIWNEVADAGWMDCSAVQNIPSVVLYESTDRLWEAPKSMKVGQKVHVSVRRQLDYITWA